MEQDRNIFCQENFLATDGQMCLASWQHRGVPTAERRARGVCSEAPSHPLK